MDETMADLYLSASVDACRLTVATLLYLSVAGQMFGFVVKENHTLELQILT